MTAIETIKQDLKTKPKTWLVTGVAGFIGSNLLEELLNLNQQVKGLDNFSTGKKENLEAVKQTVSPDTWKNFSFQHGDIRNLDHCHEAVDGADYILHQAALGSVPRSIRDPITTNQNNIDGFLNMLVAARDKKVSRFVYAASSSTYGDHPDLPKVEDRIGNPLSPYAVTKYVNELYADVFAKTYEIETVGLRYFNVFGKRQDPEGAYAAVIPKWIGQLLNNETPTINGDGKTSRDFCYIDNAVQGNLLAATTKNPEAVNRVFNIAFGERTTLSKLYFMVRKYIGRHEDYHGTNEVEPHFGPQRPGDVQHSLADISLAKQLLQYIPSHSVTAGMLETVSWYLAYNYAAANKD